MPRISEFYGILVYMYFQDHSPPHFHALYGGFEALVDIQTGELMRGSLPLRAEKMVLEWLRIHRDELMEDWKRAQEGLPLKSIEPLE